MSDSGPGFTDEARENFGTPFFSTKSQGTGLGLAIVRSIAQAHGGRIRLLDGPGARFEIEIPVDPEEAQA